jgi:hypothetical protein
MTSHYGCWNTERKAAYIVKNGYYIIKGGDHIFLGMTVQVKVKVHTDTSSEACQYRLTTPDPRCEGCRK